MKYVILIVEDNPHILYNTKLILEFNNYHPITATNGEEALKLLHELETPPDLILCDIMMPIMDGYQFYYSVSENPENPDWSFIPFIFLTAKASPEDVRLGKKLGADDYITKPFEERDLLVSIEGRITKSNKHKNMRQQIEKELLTSLKIDSSPSIGVYEKESVVLLLFFWDEVFGPQLKKHFPVKVDQSDALENIGMQLFHIAVSIYGQEIPEDAQGVLLRVRNLKRDGYLFFDSITDEKVRGGKRQFLLVSLAHKINYIESLRIREVLEKGAIKIRENAEWDIRICWEQIVEILSTPSIT